LAKQHGVGAIQDANRIALRLPALCGTPTREEVCQVLEVSVVEQQEMNWLRVFSRADAARPGRGAS
jgi:hypothetical protein